MALCIQPIPRPGLNLAWGSGPMVWMQISHWWVYIIALMVAKKEIRQILPLSRGAYIHPWTIRAKFGMQKKNLGLHPVAKFNLDRSTVLQFRDKNPTTKTSDNMAETENCSAPILTWTLNSNEFHTILTRLDRIFSVRIQNNLRNFE